MTIVEKAKALKELIKEYAVKSDDKTLVIATSEYFERWKQGVYSIGDVRTDESGKPYECFVPHDSTVNTTWDISVRTLWKPYHSKKKEFALPFERPTGSHDMYLVGEYMTDNGNTYLCKEDTVYHPSEYSQAWEMV